MIVSDAAVPLPGGCLSRDMAAELRARGYWVYRPFWRVYRDRFADRYFFARECGESKLVSLLWAL
jgi:hypothetical protein